MVQPGERRLGTSLREAPGGVGGTGIARVFSQCVLYNIVQKVLRIICVLSFVAIVFLFFTAVCFLLYVALQFRF